jgi:glyoxylase-like metal-dependent hydrolase (beta-lactamase superfamily II)
LGVPTLSENKRSVRAVSARYDAPVWIDQGGRARIADLPELTTLPNGVEVFRLSGVDEGQVAFHIVPERTLVVAEFFLSTERGLRVAPSPATRNLDAFTASLDQLRDLPIDRVLVAHGPPVLSDASAAIRDALDAFANYDWPSPN